MPSRMSRAFGGLDVRTQRQHVGKQTSVRGAPQYLHVIGRPDDGRQDPVIASNAPPGPESRRHPGMIKDSGGSALSTAGGL